ncbi:DUF2927 domain-containing protein [Alkalihalobacillus sp. AL-G]|uniref:DUF2927 domain-containing protein n=1 Tax=Alkalihalobacillus sp. AL-G TaxID=2926399 RepID=UPI0027297CC1|nr:DUF2927 domain-containing protein [Alkalihalobacillus sp. AL-G]WLD93595.1 DUF2927 domain-containing protein [Alkalihalobacillus sp. AL-G]
MKKIALLILFLFSSFLVLSVQPSFTIEGVGNGKVYAEDPIIQIEDGFGKLHIELNGEPIQNGYEITENGEYELTVRSTILWKDKIENITFERDDTPPRKPAIMHGVESVYFKEAKFELINEEDVTYEATVDGFPYTFNTPIKKEGEHVLRITAFKDNGLSSQAKYTFSIDNTTYTKKEIDMFIDFYFEHETELFKFTDDIDVIVHGKPTEQDIKKTKDVIEKLNEMLPFTLTYKKDASIKFFKNQINMYFTSVDDFSSYGFEGDIVNGEKMVIGFAKSEEVYYEEGITKAIVLVATDITQREREATIIHELTHAVGLYNHFENDPTSILYPYSEGQVMTWNKKDAKMIELLYREEVTVGMGKWAVRQILEPRTVKK